MRSEVVTDTPFGMNLTSREALFWSNRVKNEFVDGCNVRDGKKRCLPSLVVIGQVKAGTTGVFETLSAHPDVIRVSNRNHREDNDRIIHGSDKELNLYVRHFRDREDSLLASVDSMHIRLQELNETKLVLEASPYYFSPHIDNREDITRFVTYVPSVKLIAMVRNPIDRAYSDFMMLTEESPELQNASFFETVVREEIRINGPALLFDKTLHHARLTASRKWPHSQTPRHFMGRLLRWGKYSMYAEQWMRVYNSSQLLFVESDALASDATVISRIFSWAGLAQTNQSVAFSNSAHCRGVENVTECERARPPKKRNMSVALQMDLVEFFRESNKRFEEMTGVDTSAWNEIVV